MVSTDHVATTEEIIKNLQARVENLEQRNSPRDIVKVQYRRFRDGSAAPKRGTQFAAGSDLHAWIQKEVSIEKSRPVDLPDFIGEEVYYETGYEPDEIVIQPGQMAIIPTGLNVRIPSGYEMQLRPRSGLAAKNQATLMNTPGTVDADYDGDGADFDVRVMLKNTHPTAPLVVKHGDRICQAVVKPVPLVIWEEAFGDNPNRLQSDRSGGLGSTGVAK